MRIVVAGGQGFIGQRIVSRCIREKIPVLSLGSREIKTYENAQVEAYAAAKTFAHLEGTIFAFRPTHIINAVAKFESRFKTENPFESLFSNFTLGASLSLIAADTKAIFVQLFSEWQLMDSNYAPKTEYLASKIALERFLEFLKENLSCLHQVYIGDTFGFPDPRGKLVITALNSIATQGSFLPRTPNQIINLSDVNQLVDNLFYVLNQSRSSKSWICSSTPLRVIEVVEILEKSDFEVPNPRTFMEHHLLARELKLNVKDLQILQTPDVRPSLRRVRSEFFHNFKSLPQT